MKNKNEIWIQENKTILSYQAEGNLLLLLFLWNLI
jgi:hypothetical protein